MSEGDLEEAWTQVEAEWDDEARHVAFVMQCRLAGKLGFAALKYRAVLATQNEAYRSPGSRPDDAKRRLGAITAIALAEMQTAATPPDDSRRTMRWVKGAASLALVLASLVLVRACMS